MTSACHCFRAVEIDSPAAANARTSARTDKRPQIALCLCPFSAVEWWPNGVFDAKRIFKQLNETSNGEKLLALVTVIKFINDTLTRRLAVNIFSFSSVRMMR